MHHDQAPAPGMHYPGRCRCAMTMTAFSLKWLCMHPLSKFKCFIRIINYL